EGPRPDPRGGVGVQRQRFVVERDRDVGGVVRAGVDRLDLADVHPRHPDGRVRRDLVGRGELDVDGVAAGDERQVLARGQIEGQDQADDDQRPEHVRPDPRALPVAAPAHLVSAATDSGVVCSVLVPWFPGTVPMCRPGRYGWLPASHSCGWPGAAPLAYGSKWSSGAGVARGNSSVGWRIAAKRSQLPLALPSDGAEAVLRAAIAK